MSGHLLDTHIWIWSLLAPEELNSKVRQVLQNNKTELWLSPISIWETLKLIEKRKLKVLEDKTSWIKKALAVSGVQEAPLNQIIAIESTNLKTDHQDPADLFIIATAKIHSLTLITSDSTLLKMKEIHCLSNK